MTPGNFLACAALLLIGAVAGYMAACVQASIEYERMRCGRCGARLKGEA